MATLPEGILTFLLTDVEASTRRWEQEPEAMRQSMVRHDALFDAVVDDHHGHIVKPRGEGDSRFAVFTSTHNALSAAAEAQQQFFSEPWETLEPIRVRMAIHTGEADLRGGDYYGTTVNRCARLRSLAHGGQTLISLASEQLVRDELPRGVQLKELGRHRLKDLTQPEHVFQLVVEGVQVDFPPLQSLDRHPTNLPVQSTPLVGREVEAETIQEWLLDPDTRLVTLTGPGGTGKTRLGLHVAANLVEEFPDGVFLVPLETVRDPDLIMQSIAQALELRETGDVSLADTVSEFLQRRRMLLLFDNFDQLVQGATQLSELMARNSQLKILVTSRVSLHIRGEREFSVPTLGLPHPNASPSLERLLDYDAIRLFVSRARDVKPGFELTPENAAAVLAICRGLDGLPLAIELAAARVRLFPPQALLKRLDRRLALLTGGARDLPARQQTLRDTIAWSYDLLDDSEKSLFRRLAAFAGGFALDSAAAVMTAVDSEDPESLSSMSGADGPNGDLDLWDSSIEVFEGLEALASKSLLRQEQSGVDSEEDPRFSMLETIREFGLEQLDRSGELGIVRESHAHYFLMLAEMAEPELGSSEQKRWLNRLDVEHRNLRAAMTCALESDNADLGLRLTASLWRFWEERGYFTEGRTWTTRMLSLAGEPQRAAQTATGAGTFAWFQGDYDEAIQLHQRALELFKEAGNEEGVAFAMSNIGVQHAEKSELDRANALFDESIERYRKLGDEGGVADVLNNLGLLATMLQNYQRGEQMLSESLNIRRRLGDVSRMGETLHNLGDNAYYRGDVDQAIEIYHESLRLYREIESPIGAIVNLLALAEVVAVTGDAAAGAQILGSVDALLERHGVKLPEEEAHRRGRVEAALREKLEDEQLSTCWEEGNALALGEAIEYAMRVTGNGVTERDRTGVASQPFREGEGHNTDSANAS